MSSRHQWLRQSPETITTKSRLANLISTWFGCGYLPVAPGTAGSAAALLIAYGLVALAGWRPIYFLGLALILLLPGIWAAGQTAKWKGMPDPGIVVVDEVLGQWITLAGATSFNWRSWLGAFCLFRVFDIWKPPPVRRLEALPGGMGIVADDVMAGTYAALVLCVAGCFNLY
jgi:phosphatidylglycerophosphatase A